jgi:hypothetical protein
MQALNLDYVALGVILAVALFFFWTQKLRTDLTALLVTLALILPWPHWNCSRRSSVFAGSSAAAAGCQTQKAASFISRPPPAWIST